MSHLLLLELPGGNDTDILLAAERRGDRVTFLTSDLAAYRNQREVQHALDRCARQIEVEGFDLNAVIAAVDRLHEEDPVDAVLCLIDIRIVDAAVLAARLGTRFLRPEVAVLLRDKFSVREALQAAGIEQPVFALATTGDAVRAAVADIGLPVLIKPSDGYGSQNIFLLQDLDDLDPFLSPIDTMLPSRADYGLGVRPTDRVLVEQFMEGPVLGCDILSRNGVHRLLGVHEKLYFPSPSFAIRGGCFCPRSALHADVEAYAFSVLDALQVDWGATHVELVATREGLRLIEVNGRMVGAMMPRLVDLSLGGSFHEALISCHLGEVVQREEPEHAPRYAASRWLSATGEGVLESFVWPAFDVHAAYVRLLAQVGDRVSPPYQNADRLACVMVADGAREAAEAEAERIGSAAEISVRP